MLLDETPSPVLAKRDFDALPNVDFKDIVEEMKRLCPTVYDIVFSMLEIDTGTENKIPTMAWFTA